MFNTPALVQAKKLTPQPAAFLNPKAKSYLHIFFPSFSTSEEHRGMKLQFSCNTVFTSFFPYLTDIQHGWKKKIYNCVFKQHKQYNSELDYSVFLNCKPLSWLTKFAFVVGISVCLSFQILD